MLALHEAADWERLGDLLQRRRVDLDSRYRNRQAFADERKIDYRLAYDIESAARINYRKTTLYAVEQAYGWEPGSIRRVLAGGEPALVAVAVEPPAPAEPARRYADPNLEAIWRMTELDEAVRLGMIALAEGMRAAREREQYRQPEGGNGAALSGH